jgi:hypothetical protein
LLLVERKPEAAREKLKWTARILGKPAMFANSVYFADRAASSPPRVRLF